MRARDPVAFLAAAVATWLGVFAGAPSALAVSGACCEGNTGACTVTADDECLEPLFLPGATCDPSPCPPAYVACCLPYADCELEAPCRCTSRGGVASQTGTGGCSPIVCIESEFGACCMGAGALDGACAIVHREVCSRVSGVFTAGGSCGPDLCGPLNNDLVQACCCINQECVITPIRLCAAGGGHPLGSGTCDFAVCTEYGAGACCLRGEDGEPVCQPHGPLVCSSLGGLFRGGGTVCESPAGSGNFTSCCRANVDGVNGVTVGDIFAYLVAYFAGTSVADFDGVRGVTVGDLFAFLSEYFRGCP